MKSIVHFAAAAFMFAAVSAHAQPAPAGSQPAGQTASRYPEPLVRDHVTADRAVRIQERQVRGATTSIEVQPLHGGRAYKVVPPSADSGQDPANMQGRAQWTIGTFK